MPFVRHRPHLKSVYPDTSTLVYGLRGDDRVMAALVEVGSRANLCLSFVHLIELAAQPQRLRADAARLERELNYVWMMPLEEIEDAEVTGFLLGRVSGEPRQIQFPSAASLSGGFGTLGATSASALLADPRLTTIAEALSAPELQANVAAMARQGGAWARRFHRDRSAPLDVSTAEAQLDHQLLGLLRERARHCHERLVALADERYLLRAHGLHRFPELTWALSQMPTSLAQLGCMPSWYSIQHCARSAASNFGERDHNTRFFSDTRRAGDWHDWQHVGIGAGYCHGFVCDRMTSQLLGDVRRRLSLPAPIVFAGDSGSFADQLRSAVD